MANRKREPEEINVPVWAKMAKRRLIDRNMTQKELAHRIGIGYTEVNAAMRGVRYSKRVEVAVKQFFGFETR